MPSAVRHPPRTIGWKLAHCPPSCKRGPGGNTGEIKAARKGTGHPTSQCRWPRTSVLSNRHFSYVRIAYETYLCLLLRLEALFGDIQFANYCSTPRKGPKDTCISIGFLLYLREDFARNFMSYYYYYHHHKK